MAVPDFQSIMLPLLKFASDKRDHHIKEARDYLASYFDISDDDRRKLLPSGKQTAFQNRVGWARTYLKQAGLLEDVGRGIFKITERGLDVLGENPEKIDMELLEKFDEYQEFKHRREEPGDKTPDAVDASDKTPEEAMFQAYQTMRQELASELLSSVKQCSPEFFEKMVVELLVGMGYGGSLKDAGEAVGRSGDGGIDGVIKEDRLGLDTIYIQSKRWEGTVSRPEVQKFAGALIGRQARKGIFITTSDFSSKAKEYVVKIESTIILIDGEQMAQLMIDSGVGVSISETYDIKKIDTDYFEEE